MNDKNETISDIANKEAQKVYSQNATQFGVSQTPIHTHNGIDSPLLAPTSLTNAVTLSALSGAVLNGLTVSNLKPPVVVFPIPFVLSVPTGTAPDGTIVIAKTGVASYALYGRANGAWINLTGL